MRGGVHVAMRVAMRAAMRAAMRVVIGAPGQVAPGRRMPAYRLIQVGGNIRKLARCIAASM